MSRIEELIKEKCPNGVEYKRLKDICSFQRGQAITIKNLEEGDYPVIAGGQNPAFYCNKFNRNYECITISSSGAYAGFINYWNEKILCTDSFSIISNDKNILSNKFLFHFLKSKQEIVYQKKKGAGIPHVHISDVDIMRIPVPPIEVQVEIVRILDKFSELGSELEAELEARKKQYEYYRNKLLKKNYIEYKLDDLCYITSGGTPPRKQNEFWDNGTIKWLSSSVCKNKKQIDSITNYITDLGLSKSSAKLLKPGTTLIAMVGATIGKVAYLDFEACTNQNVASLFPKDKNILNNEYLFYACTNLYSKFMDLSNGSFTIANLEFIKKLKISLPPLEEQERIVNILDKFDKLVNDISEGIPSEIASRSKQYEYYRNKLLSFEVMK